MAHPSTPDFRTLHALRIKGFATIDTLSEMTTLGAVTVQEHLDGFAAAGHAQFRAARSLWQLTPDGRANHPVHLTADVASVDLSPLGVGYTEFLVLNGSFKELCGEWQLRDGEINDHSDATYDATVIGRLGELDEAAQPVVAAMGDVLERFCSYSIRLGQIRTRLERGEVQLFTGVMCGSYHDAWMELHEDLLLTQGIDRHAEGSF